MGAPAAWERRDSRRFEVRFLEVGGVRPPRTVRHGISPRIRVMGRIYKGVCNDIIGSRNNNVRNIFRRVKRDVKAEEMSDTWPGLEIVVGSSARAFRRVFGNSEVV